MDQSQDADDIPEVDETQKFVETQKVQASKPEESIIFFKEK